MINRRLNEVLSEKDSAYWLAALEDKRIPCAPVNRFSQALADEFNDLLQSPDPLAGVTVHP